MYFQVHQPYRIKKYRIFDIGNNLNYFDANDHTDLNNRKVFHKVATKCYLPANKVFLELLKKYPEFKIAYSLSGVFLEQAQEFMPEVIESFQELVKTGRVEILSETYYHSLAFLYSVDEYKSQIKLHREKIEELFGVTPTVFRNTELIYNDWIGSIVESLGYKGILTEGADKILGWKSPNYLYKAHGTQDLKLLLKNYKLSDDVAFRFSEKSWKEHPLTVDKYAQWLNVPQGDVVNLFMDYETFGEHQWEDSGIFEFLKHFPGEILKNPHNHFITPTEAVATLPAVDELSIPYYISWADTERDLSAWMSNDIQKDAMGKLFQMEHEVLESDDPVLIHDWRKLTTSDHFYYMCTKWFSDGDVHKYFNPYETPYDAFIAFMNVVNDIRMRIAKNKEEKNGQAHSDQATHMAT
ncbi:MAG: glycoside hydrolase family 57 protein [Candidatus Levybacteria bacterium]|nr:glycoside hydrolase family 57 protein [Candidatus Levybacteria bacterium]